RRPTSSGAVRGRRSRSPDPRGRSRTSRPLEGGREPSREGLRMKILVTGATGDVGREVTARLLEDGLAVRALCRAAPDGLPLGVEVASGTLESPAQLAAATRGVD